MTSGPTRLSARSSRWLTEKRLWNSTVGLSRWQQLWTSVTRVTGPSQPQQFARNGSPKRQKTFHLGSQICESTESKTGPMKKLKSRLTKTITLLSIKNRGKLPYPDSQALQLPSPRLMCPLLQKSDPTLALNTTKGSKLQLTSESPGVKGVTFQ